MIFKLVLSSSELMWLNKPAAQAAGKTLPDVTPPVAKIHTFSKITITFDQYSDLDVLQDLEYLKKIQSSFFYDWKHHF